MRAFRDCSSPAHCITSKSRCNYSWPKLLLSIMRGIVRCHWCNTMREVGLGGRRWVADIARRSGDFGANAERQRQRSARPMESSAFNPHVSFHKRATIRQSARSHRHRHRPRHRPRHHLAAPCATRNTDRGEGRGGRGRGRRGGDFLNNNNHNNNSNSNKK